MRMGSGRLGESNAGEAVRWWVSLMEVDINRVGGLPRKLEGWLRAGLGIDLDLGRKSRLNCRIHPVIIWYD